MHEWRRDSLRKLAAVDLRVFRANDSRRCVDARQLVQSNVGQSELDSYLVSRQVFHKMIYMDTLS